MSEELKPCPLDEARKTLWYCAQFTDGSNWKNQYRKALKTICNELDRRAQQPNESLTLCKEDENFIQNKFGYCFYTLDSQPLIYNLYVHPEYRRQGHSRELLELVISVIQRSGYEGKIRIQAKPRENSIELATLIRYYKSMGFIVCNAHQPEAGENNA